MYLNCVNCPLRPNGSSLILPVVERIANIGIPLDFLDFCNFSVAVAVGVSDR